jgi:hypothetical protein
MNMNPTRKTAEIAFAAVLVAAAGWICFEAQAFPQQSGYYPQALGAMLAVSGLIMLIRTAMSHSDGSRLMYHPGRCFTGFLIVFLYLFAVSYLGYIIPSIILSISVPALLGYRNWRILLPVALGTVFSIYIIFGVLLERPMPPDILLGLL